MALDLDQLLRWLKPEKRTSPPASRPNDQLPWASDAAPAGGELMLDTCVYIDQLQGRLPNEAQRLLAARTLNHSAVSVMEMTHLFGRLDPADPRTNRTLKTVAGVLNAIPAHRLHEADAPTMAAAGILSGLLCRLNGYGTEQRQRALHDCILYLQARKLGLIVLTRNVGDFDQIQQLAPDGRVLFYRRQGTPPFYG